MRALISMIYFPVSAHDNTQYWRLMLGTDLWGYLGRCSILYFDYAVGSLASPYNQVLA